MIEWNTDLSSPGDWMWSSPILPGNATTNALWFPEIEITNPPVNFSRAVAWGAYLSPSGLLSTALRPNAQGKGGTVSSFTVNIANALPTNMTMYYAISGSASNGVDYEPLSGSVVMPFNQTTATVTVQPIYRANLGFDPIAVFTLVPTNGYFVDSNQGAVSIPIMDNFSSNILTIVCANADQTVDVDWLAASNSLFLSVGYPSGSGGNFALLGANSGGNLTDWSAVANIPWEVNMTTIKVTANGFHAGDVYFIAEDTGTIGWVSASGTLSNPNWLAVPNETDPGESSDLYQDQTGLWTNNLLAVTSRPNANESDVWIITAQTNAILLASNLPVPAMEGLLTLPNNAIYGPWAGKLIVGNETTNTLYTIDTNGVVETWNLGTPGFGVAGQAFLVVPGTNDDFYCEDSAWWGPGDSSFSYIRKLPGAFFPTNSGDIIVAQCPEENNNLQPQTIWLLRWNGTAFGTSCLILSNFTEGPLKFSPDFGLVEKGVFAPIHIGTEP